MPKEHREAFVKELRDLCAKHGLYIVLWSGSNRLVPLHASGEDVMASFGSVLEELLETEEGHA